MSERSRVLTVLLVLTGLTASATLLATAAATGRWTVLPPAVLPAAFLVAGLLGARARPDHRGVQLLLSVGALHLVAFAITAPLATGAWAATAGDVSAWLVALVGAAAFQGGFACFAVLLAGYPHSPAPAARPVLFTRGVLVAWCAVVVAEAAFLHRLQLTLTDLVSEVRAPAGLPLAALPFDPQPLMPLAVVLGAAVLVVRARRSSEEDPQAMRWATLAAIVVALLLLSTPAASVLVPDLLWAVVFLTVVSTVPFVLLAGLVRFRALGVDLLLTRTLARGLLGVAVLSGYAAAAAALAGSALTVAAVVLTLAAVVTGGPVLRAAERLADRVATGGRVHRARLLDHLAGELAAADPALLPSRVCRAVAEALDVSWVSIEGDRLGRTSHGVVGAEVAARAPLRVAGAELGVLACGPRRGGWHRSEQATLDRVAGQTAPSLHAAVLNGELAARVQELTTSRHRLVRAEETVRRQVERDLHDGVQQQLVALLARLSLARELLAPEDRAGTPVTEAHRLAAEALRDLRDLVIGIHPALLDDRGLPAAVAARAALLPLPVAVDTDPRVASARYLGEVERAAYFVVCEALANVMKHSGSREVRVVLVPLGTEGLRVAVVDDGNGEAVPTGRGLSGLRDRVEALGGTFTVQATPDVGTTLVADFPDAVAGVAADA